MLLNSSRVKEQNKAEDDLKPHSLEYFENVIKHWF